MSSSSRRVDVTTAAIVRRYWIPCALSPIPILFSPMIGATKLNLCCGIGTRSLGVVRECLTEGTSEHCNHLQNICDFRCWSSFQVLWACCTTSKLIFDSFMST